MPPKFKPGDRVRLTDHAIGTFPWLAKARAVPLIVVRCDADGWGHQTQGNANRSFHAAWLERIP